MRDNNGKLKRNTNFVLFNGRGGFEVIDVTLNFSFITGESESKCKFQEFFRVLTESN